MSRRFGTAIAFASLAFASALAKGQAVEGTPVSLNQAQNWCVAQVGPVPNWKTPAHPECKMVWREMAERNGRVLYSARYAWPSARLSTTPRRVLTEVLFEGAKGSRVVRPLFAAQEDETDVRLEPLRIVTVGTAKIVESRICMSGTDECGRDLAVWTDERMETISDNTIAEIRSQLPKGYGLQATPTIDLASLSGSGNAWASRDAECCPSAKFAFTLRLTDRELHLDQLTFEPKPTVARK